MKRFSSPEIIALLILTTFSLAFFESAANAIDESGQEARLHNTSLESKYKGRCWLAAGKILQATKCFEDEAQYGGHLSVMLDLYVRTGNLAAANRVLTKEFSDSDYGLRAAYYEIIGDYKGAELDYLRADSAFETAGFYQRQSQLDKAIKYWNIAVLERPSLWLCYRARCHEAMKDYKLAEQDFNAAVENPESCSRALIDRARFYQRRGDSHKSLIDLNRAVEIDPATYLHHRSRYYEDTGNLVAAQEDLVQAVQKSESDYERNLSALELAYFLYRQGKLDEALRELESIKVEKSDESLCRILTLKGCILKRQGKLSESRKNLEAVLRYTPDQTPEYLDLSIALIELNRSGDVLNMMKGYLRPGCHLSSENALLAGIALAKCGNKRRSKEVMSKAHNAILNPSLEFERSTDAPDYMPASLLELKSLSKLTTNVN